VLVGSSRSQLWTFQRTSHINYPDERPTGLLSRREATKPTHHKKGAVAEIGISCCGFQVVVLVWSWGLCVRFADAHHQELKSIIQWLLPVVFGAVIFKLLFWCGAVGCVSGLHPANRIHNPQLHTRPTTWKPQHEIPQAATTV